MIGFPTADFDTLDVALAAYRHAKGVLVAERKCSDGGLGYQLGIYYEQFRIAPMYAIIVIIFALAAGANVGMTMLQDRVNRHMAPTATKGKGRRPAASGNLGVVATN